MTVNTICNHNVAAIRADASVTDAATRMRAEHVGALIVTELRGSVETPIGIVTDRDIVVAILAKRVSPDAVTVGDAMTRNLLIAREADSVEFALREMRRRGVRRVPVVGTRGELVGILTVDDAVQHYAAQLGRLADVIRTEQTTETQARP
jgi:CBS domain-containing protein